MGFADDFGTPIEVLDLVECSNQDVVALAFSQQAYRQDQRRRSGRVNAIGRAKARRGDGDLAFGYTELSDENARSVRAGDQDSPGQTEVVGLALQQVARSFRRQTRLK